MSANVHLSYSKVAVATHFMVSMPFIPVATCVLAQISKHSVDCVVEKSEAAINACLAMAMFSNVKKAIGSENSTITDLDIQYVDGMINIHGSIHRFNINRASREFVKIFTKWDAARSRGKASKYCAAFGFKKYTEYLGEAIAQLESGVGGNVDVYILTRNKNPATPGEKEPAAAKEKRVKKRDAVIAAIRELQTNIKQLVKLKRGTPDVSHDGDKYDNIGAFILSKLLGIDSMGSFIVAEKDKVKKAASAFADRLKKKKTPDKALWHLITMAICSGNVTAAALAEFAAKIDDSSAIAFIKGLGRK